MADPAAALYRMIDWSKCVIAGSYALWQYDRPSAPDWQPADIDVVCEAATTKAFDEHVERLRKAAGVDTLVKTAEYGGGKPPWTMSTVTTATMRVRGIPLPVQLVGVRVPHGGTLLHHLAQTTDLPASVYYTVPGQNKMFHLSEACAAAIRTRRVPRAGVSAARRAKYEARGYAFVDE